MRRPALFLIALLLPLGFIGWSLLHPFSEQAFFLIFVAVFLAMIGFVIYLPLRFRLARSSGHGEQSHLVSWLIFLSMGFLSFALTFCIFKDLLALIFLILDPRLAAIMESPLGSGTVIALDLAALVISSYLALFRVRLERIPMRFPDLPPALEGFTILQMSDLHLGATIGAPFIRRILRLSRQLPAHQPDLFVITGDIADAQPHDVQAGLDLLDGIPARRGRFYVYGNHELYWGMPEWVAEMKKRRYHVLNNECATLEVERAGNRAQLAVCGVTDTATAQFVPSMASDAKITARQIPAGAFSILLSHQPHLAEENSALGFRVQLSGHTHGGQFAPWIWAIYFFQKFVRGLYTIGSLQLYVHRGTGTWGPPFRLGSPPEMTLIELQRR